MRFVVVLDLEELVVEPRCTATLFAQHRTNGLTAVGPDLPATLVALAERIVFADQHNALIDAIDAIEDD